MAKKDLDRANKDQLDEFYTLYSDIAGELGRYSHIFKGKTVIVIVIARGLILLNTLRITLSS